MEKASMAIATSESINWKEIYDHLLPRVFHFFCYKVGDRFLAEELTAITFEKAWVNRSNYKRDVTAFRFWLFGIAQKVAADHFRKRSFEVPLDTVNVPSSQNVEKEVESQMDFERLASILSTVADRERLLIALKCGAELNNREIARHTAARLENDHSIRDRICES